MPKHRCHVLTYVLGEERSDPEGKKIGLFPQISIDLWAGFGFVLVYFCPTYTGLGLHLCYRIVRGRIRYFLSPSE